MSKQTTSTAPSYFSSFVNSASSAAVAVTKGAIYVASSGAGVVQDYMYPKKIKQEPEVKKYGPKSFEPQGVPTPSLAESLVRRFKNYWNPVYKPRKYNHHAKWVPINPKEWIKEQEEVHNKKAKKGFWKACKKKFKVKKLNIFGS